MNPKELFILHGEKALVALVALICLYCLIDVVTDKGIRPEGYGPVAIDAGFKKVDEVRNTAKPPILKLPDDYLGGLQSRFARSVAGKPAMAWITVHRDYGPLDVPPKFVYIYELLPAQIEVNDKIGSFEITFTLPESIRGKDKDDRLSDVPDKAWSRSESADAKAGKIENAAAYAGIVIEVQVGKKPWAPLQAPGVGAGGFLAFDDKGGGLKPIVLNNVQAWETYNFRARLAAKATGLPFDAAAGPDQMVLVSTKRVVGEGESLDWGTLGQQVATYPLEAALTGKFQPGQPGNNPYGVALKPKERLYLSDFSAKEIVASSSVRFVLERVSPDLNNPVLDEAQILLTKLLRDPTGKGWWLKAVEFKLKVNEPLGDANFNGEVPWDKKGKHPIDLSTDYVLVKTDKDVDRTVYYEVKEKQRAGGGKDKDLELEPKVLKTDVAVLRNTKTQQEMTLLKLDRIRKPARPNAVLYPEIPGALKVEKEDFERNPGTFVQLAPQEPTKFGPGTGPLEDLHKAGNDLAQTDTDYFEFPDGRLVYWELVNHHVAVLYKLGYEKPAPPPPPVATPAPTPAPAPPATPPVPAHPPATAPHPPATAPHPPATAPKTPK